MGLGALPAGLGVPKRRLEGLQQTAGLNANKKLLIWALAGIVAVDKHII